MPKSLKRLKRERSFKNCFSLLKNIKITGIKTAKKEIHTSPPGEKRKDKSIEKLGAEDGQRSGDSVLGGLCFRSESSRSEVTAFRVFPVYFFCGSRFCVMFSKTP
jgi:hypothetical protein